MSTYATGLRILFQWDSNNNVEGALRVFIIIIINNIIVTGTITKKRLQHVAMKHSFYSSKNCLAILAAQMRPPFCSSKHAACR